jgi:hypothetical protein
VGSAERAHESQVAHSLSEGLRAEYTALAAFLGTANTFRFTVLGLFLAAAGLMLSDPTDVKASLLLAVSLALWLAELRTRSLISHVLRRGSDIERYWNIESGTEKQFMTRFADEWETDDLSTLKGVDRPTICVFLWNLPVPVLRHSIVIDVIFLGVAAAAVWQLLLNE